MSSEKRFDINIGWSTKSFKLIVWSFFVLTNLYFFMGTFVITKRLNGSYKYEFNSRKGKAILISEDFELRFECEEAIEALKQAEDVFG